MSTENNILTTKAAMELYETTMNNAVKNKTAFVYEFIDKNDLQRKIYIFETREQCLETMQPLVTKNIFGKISMPDELDAFPLLTGSVVVRLDVAVNRNAPDALPLTTILGSDVVPEYISSVTETYNNDYARDALTKKAAFLTPIYRAHAHNIGVSYCL
jgi:hypothetical protein